MAAGIVFVVFLLLAIACPLVLYLLIQSETSDDSVMSRDEAERAARDGYEKAKKHTVNDSPPQFSRSASPPRNCEVSGILRVTALL